MKTRKYCGYGLFIVFSLVAILMAVERPESLPGFLVTLFVYPLPVILFRFCIAKNKAVLDRKAVIACALYWIAASTVTNFIMDNFPAGAAVLLESILNYRILTREGKAQDDKAKTEDLSKKDTVFDSSKLMTGQLVALYKKTHDEKYSDRYKERLTKIGFSKTEAENFFMYELMTLKSDSVDILCDEDYIKRDYLDLKNVLLSESYEYYADHQTFLVSELTKIWDEAEWHYNNSHEKEMPDEVWGEICRLSRYGGAELLIKGLSKAAESTHTELLKVQDYSIAEQGLLYRYKWYPDSDERHPYGE